MRNAVLLCFLLVMAGVATAGGTGGEDSGPNPTETPFATHQATSPSADGETWTLSVTLDSEAVENGTALLLTTQICTNDGVCDPPIDQTATVSEDGAVHTISVTPPEDHTYVNWRAKVTYAGGEEEFHPFGDWYTTWSTCYFDDGEWGGEASTEDGCEEKSPGPGVVLSLVAITVAAATVSRRSRNA